MERTDKDSPGHGNYMILNPGITTPWSTIIEHLKDTYGKYEYVFFTNPTNGKECAIIPTKYHKDKLTIPLVKRNLIY